MLKFGRAISSSCTPNWLIGLLVILLSASSIFGGPLGVIGRGERHVLLILAVTVSIYELVKVRFQGVLRFVAAHPVVVVPALFALVNFLWVFNLLTKESGARVALGMMDAQSLVVPLVTPVIVIAMRRHLHSLVGLITMLVISVSILAAIQLGIWLFMVAHPIDRENVSALVNVVFGTTEGVNIIRQQNGMVWYTRIIWISSYWLLPCLFLAPLVIERKLPLLIIQTSISAAIIISYTRGIWVGAGIGAISLLLALTSTQRRRAKWSHRLAKPMVISLAGIGLAVAIVQVASIAGGEPMGLFARLSLPTNGLVPGDSEGVFDRVEQTRRLLEMWQENPWFGHGYGAFIPDLIRHADRPFLYEMVPPALLMKLGIVGFSLYLLSLFLISVRLWVLSGKARLALMLLPAFIGYLCQIHTNPVFFSFTGMFIFSVLLSTWIYVEISEKAHAKQA